MAVVFTKAAQLFCTIGGPWVAPFILPFWMLTPFAFPIALIYWAILLICFFTPIMVAGPNGKNSLNSDKDGNKKGGKAFGFAVLFYWLCMLSVMCSVMQSVCKVTGKVDLGTAPGLLDKAGVLKGAYGELGTIPSNAKFDPSMLSSFGQKYAPAAQNIIGAVQSTLGK